MRFAPGTPQSVINAAAMAPTDMTRPREIPRQFTKPAFEPQMFSALMGGGRPNIFPRNAGLGQVQASPAGMTPPPPIPRQFTQAGFGEQLFSAITGGGRPNIPLLPSRPETVNDRYNAQLAAQSQASPAGATLRRSIPGIDRPIINDFEPPLVSREIPYRPPSGATPPPPPPQFDSNAFNTFMGGLDENQRNMVQQFAFQRAQDAASQAQQQFQQMQQSPTFQSLSPNIPGGGIASLFGGFGQPMGGPMGGFGGGFGGGYNQSMGGFGQPMGGFGGFGQPMGGFGGFGQPMGGFGGFGQPMGGFGGGFGQPMGGFGGGFGQPMGGFGQQQSAVGPAPQQGGSPYGSSGGRMGLF